MKIILFASALALSTAAIAQDTTAPATPPADASVPPAAPATPDASAPQTTPDATAPAAAPDASAPAPAPAMGDATGAQQAASSTDDSNLPTCSRTVTDKCKQGAGRSSGHAGHHRATHHKKK